MRSSTPAGPAGERRGGRPEPGRPLTRPRGDDGTVLVLVLGLASVLIALVAVVADVSAAVLARRSLVSAADGAAVSAAQALDEERFYADGIAQGVPLSADAVAQRVAAYEAAARLDQPGLRLAGTVEDGTTAVVSATRTVDLPLRRWTGRGPVQLTAEARARAPLAEAR